MSTTPDSTPPATQTAPTVSRPASGGEIAGFVVSILGLVTSFIGGGFLLGLVALVILGVTSRRVEGRHGLARAGTILAIIAMALGVLFAIRAGSAAIGS